MPTPPDFNALAALGRVADLRSLVDHIAPRSRSRDASAVRAAAAILERATPEEVAWLERNRPGGHEYTDWYHLQPSDLGAPPLLPESSSAPVVALASMHPSGFVREAAVRLLGTRTDGAELPWLLLRLNDWVPEIRKAAESAVRDRLVPSYSGRFVACLGLVERLRGVRRASQPALLGEIDRLLSEEAAWGALFEGLHATSAAVRQAAARIAVLRGDAVLVLRAATSHDPRVAIAGARAIAATWTPEALREVLPVLRRGTSSVRWIALAAVCDKLPGEAELYLRQSLLDGSTSVRELARYRWTKVGLAPLDFAAFYRVALSSAEPAGRRDPPLPGRRRGKRRDALAIAARGLAETGTEKDGPLFDGLVGHGNAAVRAAAVAGLGRCGGPARHGSLLLAMDDPSTRVAAEARRWVRLHLGRAAVRPRSPAA